MGGQKQVSMQIFVLSYTVKVMVAVRIRLPPGNLGFVEPLGINAIQKLTPPLRINILVSQVKKP